MTGARFTWVQLSDLQVGPEGPARHESLLADLELLHKRTGPWHSIFLTGDVSRTGAEAEFVMVDRIMTSTMDMLRSGGSKPKLYAVPGNHDLQRRRVNASLAMLPEVWSVDPAVRARFFSREQDGLRHEVNLLFQPFSSWRERWAGLPDAGLLAGDFADGIEIGTHAVGMLGLNTAFLALGPHDAYGRLTVDVRQLEAVSGGDVRTWSDAHLLNVLLTHHPPDWLDHPGRANYWSELGAARGFQVHLHGHVHGPRPFVSRSGGFRPQVSVSPPATDAGLRGYVVGDVLLGRRESILRLWPRRPSAHDPYVWESAAAVGVTPTTDGAIVLSLGEPGSPRD
jgi:predicted MPP superfamily phosphohydrolase